MSMNMTRRGLMRRGGLAAAGAAGLGLPAQAAVAAPVDNPARVPAGTALIDVAADSSRWQAGVANQDSSTTLQGIAFDSANGHFYTLQVAGASQIAYLRSGSQAAVTASIGADVHAESGDLCLTRHDIATGAVNGYMYLLGFGHGVSLGVQPASGGNPAYVWTEAGSGRSGYGQEFVRFPFVTKTVLWTSDPSVHGTPDTNTSATFQGFTSYGQYVCMLSGDPRTSTPSSNLTGIDKWAVHTTSFDLNGRPFPALGEGRSGAAGRLPRVGEAARRRVGGAVSRSGGWRRGRSWPSTRPRTGSTRRSRCRCRPCPSSRCR
ncbi:hypothetical protein [Streptomyces goshikiensis]|uniref:hypothetical protein n=1 Tax=Streptomyces goshikiensis TaxID=1942 RepID=UPI002E0E138E|nr:hypothetical protein OG224_28060 [Streptomyces goshikiensis]